jgi:hypothetical protein
MVDGYDYRVLVCQACGEEFVLTSDAQEYMERQGRREIPRWCRTCYVEMKKAKRAAANEDNQPSQAR